MEENKRTNSQNKALHKLFSILSEELNSAGLDQRVVLKPGFSIWWTPESIKSNIWKPLQEAMFQKEHTSELNKQQINKIFEQLAKIFGEKYGLELFFPSIEESENYINSLENQK